MSTFIDDAQPRNTLQQGMVQYNIIQYNTIQYNTMQYNAIGESFVTSLFTFCFISIHFQVEKETR